MFVHFKEPYNLYVVKDKLTAIKLIGENVHLYTTDGVIFKIAQRDYNIEEIVNMCMPSAKASTPTRTPSKAQAKKSLDK